MIKDYSELTSRIYTQLSPELSQEFHNMLTDMAQEISRLYEIENANPSEALELFNEDVVYNIQKAMILSKEDTDIIKQYILKAQVQEKALSIIKEKPIESGIAINNIKKQRDYSQYKKTILDLSQTFLLTEQEFNLLKEVLK